MRHIVILGLLGVVILAPYSAFAQAGNCTNLLSTSFPDVRLTAAVVIPAAGALPGYCRVLGFVSTTIGFELRLPTTWNGKFYFVGGSVWAGRLPQRVVSVATGASMQLGLSRGYATAVTDTGHASASIFDASWALNNRAAVIDFSYRGVHLTTEAAKSIIEAYYGTGPAQSYFEGCSTGGYQGLQEAQRFPKDFDGIIAGAPTIDLTGGITAINWNMQVLYKDPASTIPVSKLGMIGDAILAKCDSIDGLTDNIIEDPRRCEFDPRSLVCTAGDAPDCLTSAQAEALAKIYSGPSNSEGRRLFPGLAVGGEKPTATWAAWLLTPPPAGILWNVQDQFLRYLAFDPPEPAFDWQTFDFDRDPARLETMGEILNATNPDLLQFAGAGGKLLIWHGWGDQVIPARRVISYYKEIQRAVGRKRTESFARLFVAPGVHHCGDGLGPNQFDALTELESWVEQGAAPGSILATHFTAGVPDRTRPLCPYPQRARYLGTGDINDAANFVCAGPPAESEDSNHDKEEEGHEL